MSPETSVLRCRPSLARGGAVLCAVIIQPWVLDSVKVSYFGMWSGTWMGSICETGETLYMHGSRS